jgi:hypothetical protein
MFLVATKQEKSAKLLPQCENDEIERISGDFDTKFFHKWLALRRNSGKIDTYRYSSKGICYRLF